MCSLAGGVPPGADVLPEYAAGDFIGPTRNNDVTKKPTSHDRPSPDDDRIDVNNRGDADVSHPTEFTPRVERFRKILVELIAKQLLSNERNPANTRDRAGD